MDNKISFSIITVTFNAKKELIKTINSIQNQSYPYFSHIIKDGLSKDKSNQINFSTYRNTFFYEEKDYGIYDAMNQAFKYAKDKYVIFLNAGDIFFSNKSLEELAENIKKKPSFNSYSGITLQVNIKKKKIIRGIGVGKLYKDLPFAQLPHPSFVLKKSVLNKINQPFDANIKIAGDYKQQLLLRKKNLWKNCYLNQIISIMPTGGSSNSSKQSIIRGYRETIIFSYKLYSFLFLYILIIKIVLNFYSRIKSHKFKNFLFPY